MHNISYTIVQWMLRGWFCLIVNRWVAINIGVSQGSKVSEFKWCRNRLKFKETDEYEAHCQRNACVVGHCQCSPQSKWVHIFTLFHFCIFTCVLCVCMQICLYVNTLIDLYWQYMNVIKKNIIIRHLVRYLLKKCIPYS